MYGSLMRFSLKNTEKVRFLLIFFQIVVKIVYNYFCFKYFYIANTSYIYISVNRVVYFFVF